MYKEIINADNCEIYTYICEEYQPPYLLMKQFFVWFHNILCYDIL